MKSFEKSFEKSPNNPDNFQDISLKELIRERHCIYIPRKIDIERIRRVALLAHDFSGKPIEGLKILDVGGGYGFFDKLIADEFNENQENALVIDIDIDMKRLKKGKEYYGDTKGLEFVAADAEKEPGHLFSDSPDLLISSWPQPDNFFAGYGYTSLIHAHNPPVVLWVGDTVINDITKEFDTKGKYIPIAEWYTRHMTETTGNSLHEIGVNPKHGDNLFTLYVRSDANADQIEQIKQALTLPIEGEKYPWEAELEQKFPQDSDRLSFDVEERKI